jgi:hypothetical protein
VWVSAGDSTTEHTPNDHRYFGVLCGVSCSVPTADVGFDIYATSIHKLTGQFKARYSWSN